MIKASRPPNVAGREVDGQSSYTLKKPPFESREPERPDAKEELAKSRARGTIGNLVMVTARRADVTTSPCRFNRRLGLGFNEI
jgi:hypothetical protein